LALRKVSRSSASLAMSIRNCSTFRVFRLFGPIAKNPVAVSISFRCASDFAGIVAGVVVVGIALRGEVWLHDNALDPPRNWFVEASYERRW
jgi:hypothetical protein